MLGISTDRPSFRTTVYEAITDTREVREADDRADIDSILTERKSPVRVNESRSAKCHVRFAQSMRPRSRRKRGASNDRPRRARRRPPTPPSARAAPPFTQEPSTAQPERPQHRTSQRPSSTSLEERTTATTVVTRGEDSLLQKPLPRRAQPQQRATTRTIHRTTVARPTHSSTDSELNGASRCMPNDRASPAKTRATSSRGTTADPAASSGACACYAAR